MASIKFTSTHSRKDVNIMEQVKKTFTGMVLELKDRLFEGTTETGVIVVGIENAQRRFEGVQIDERQCK